MKDILVYIYQKEENLLYAQNNKDLSKLRKLIYVQDF